MSKIRLSRSLARVRTCRDRAIRSARRATPAGHVNKKLASAAIVLVGGVLAVPAVASAKGPCGNDFGASSACSLQSTAGVKGNLAEVGERDYYAFQAVKGTKLRLSITDTESACNGHFVTCGSVKAKLLNSRGHELAHTASALPALGARSQPQRLSYTVARAGRYYVLVTGTLGKVTPPPGGGQAHPEPLTYLTRETSRHTLISGRPRERTLADGDQHRDALLHLSVTTTAGAGTGTPPAPASSRRVAR
jgi:hypothetical protein